MNANSGKELEGHDRGLSECRQYTQETGKNREILQ
jgi:hypothetical protein